MSARACRVLPYRRTVRPVQHPARSIGAAIALELLARWQAPATETNIAAVEDLFRVPIAQISQLAASAPRSWVCSGTPAEVGLRITEA